MHDCPHKFIEIQNLKYEFTDKFNNVPKYLLHDTRHVLLH